MTHLNETQNVFINLKTDVYLLFKHSQTAILLAAVVWTGKYKITISAFE